MKDDMEVPEIMLRCFNCGKEITGPKSDVSIDYMTLNIFYSKKCRDERKKAKIH